jgi:molybdopterin/thiamine biosynthesis adenylyltransferase
VRSRKLSTPTRLSAGCSTGRHVSGTETPWRGAADARPTVRAPQFGGRLGADELCVAQANKTYPAEGVSCAGGLPRSPADRELPLAGFVDRTSGSRIEVHHPLESPDRWRAYLDGAVSRYRAHGVLRALDRRELEDGRTTSLFFVAVDDADRVVAGLRCHGPLRAASEAYALRELEGHPGLPVVRNLLEERVPSGLVELKGAWVDPNFPGPGLSDALARCYVHAMNWFGARFAICTCAVETAPRWQTTGARRVEGLEPIGYPDDRYQTVVLWWDRSLVKQLSDAEQWSRLMDESDELMSGINAPKVDPLLLAPADDVPMWRPEVLDQRVGDDRARLAKLLADPGVEVLDRWTEQVDALHKIRSSVPASLAEPSSRWVYYPWRHCLVRLLGPSEFRASRLDRNRNKITCDEQEGLARLRVGVVGLSVGHSIAYVLAQEGICGELRLADFDTIELSNLNRIPATVMDLGVNKAVAVSRRISELDPYLSLVLVPDGLTASTIDTFIDGLDVVVEECDSLDLKLLVREAARRAGIPVLMETSDRGLLDVERFDLEPNRPVFHGLLGDVQARDLIGLSTHHKVPYVLRILEPTQLSSRMAASMAEIDETLVTWPQLGGDVSLGAATIAAAIRRLGRGEPLPSGRVRVDLEAVLDALAEPEKPYVGDLAPAATADPPDDPALAVAHAANLAPSGGNSQPWSLQLDAVGLRLLLNRERTSSMDVRFRGSYVAIGAAILNARIAAAAHGILGPVEYFPEGEHSDVVARINFGRSSDVDLASRYSAMLDRSTNRKPGQPHPLDSALVEELHQRAASQGARLRLLTLGDELEDYAELLGESDRLRYLSPVLHAEMMQELRWPGLDPLEQGIDVRTLELDDADLSKLSVARRADVMADLAAWNGGRALGQVTRERVRSSSALAVVTVADTRPRSYVSGGAAVQGIWLAAAAAGLAVQPVSPLSVFAVDAQDFAGLVPAPYLPRLKALTARLRALAGVAEGEALALILRLSHAGPPSVRSLRIPLQAVLLGGSGLRNTT